jgi:hypothetical protein
MLGKYIGWHSFIVQLLGCQDKHKVQKRMAREVAKARN